MTAPTDQSDDLQELRERFHRARRDPATRESRRKRRKTARRRAAVLLRALRDEDGTGSD